MAVIVHASKRGPPVDVGSAGLYAPGMRRVGWVALFALGLSSCGLFKSESSSSNALEFVRKDAAAVVELRDVSMLVDLRASISKNFGSVLSEADIDKMGEELALMLGFDPTTKEGLKGVGLATSGPVVGELFLDSESGLWAIPVEDAKKLEPVIGTVMKSRAKIDETKTETKDGVKVTSYLVEFGERKVVRAAHAVSKGHLVLGVGPESVDLVVRGVKLPAADAALASPEYKTLAAQLGNDFDIRMTSSQGAQAAIMAAQQAGQDVEALRPVVDRITSAGWIVRYDGRRIAIDGRARLDEAGRTEMKKVFASKGAPPPGIKALNLPQAVVYAQASGDPQALLDLLAPKGSDLRRDFDQMVEDVKSDTTIDLMTEVMPQLSGHGALAAGTGDLSKVDFKEMAGNPAGVAWVTFAASTPKPDALAAAEKKLDTQLSARGISIQERKVKDTVIRDLVPTGPDGARPPGESVPLVSTFTHGGTWGFSVEPLITKLVVENKAQVDALSGKPGMVLELRIARLVAELRQFRATQLDLVYRAFFVKMIDYLSLIDRVSLHVGPVGDGARMQAELQFAPQVARTP